MMRASAPRSARQRRMLRRCRSRSSPCRTSRRVGTASALDRLREAMGSPATLLDVHVDPDHHRSVYTLVGDDDVLVETLVARDRGGARGHRPPPPRGRPSADRRRRRRAPRPDPARGRAARSSGGPRARRPRRRARAARLLLRTPDGRRARAGVLPPRRARGAAAANRRGELAPDRGPSRLHPTGGGVVLGVRRPLIAFNVNLRSQRRRRARAPSRRSSASATAASPACARSASTCPRPGSSRSA